MENVTKAILVCILGIATMLFTRDRGRVPPLSTRNLNLSYDYIIVGGGTAGSVLANRLTEDPEVTVLLLEAGDEETNKPMYDIPWNAPRSQMTEADWIYRTVPQKTSCLAMKDRTMIWPRGKGLGGSTLVNGLVYIRGSRYDFEEWFANGCDGWNYEDVLPYFIKLEDYRIFDKHVDPGDDV
ncbi:hypothetical protein CHS0354_033653 [Potamilus streckersoni]|uniref:Glucose-methanol-choline oxidoreductase N-terminal domain-containing protein n=1 Tax=Potamilus streckersoni TaxID=2493646 RepID=A0AAE0S279_9BIVA|nr:hypothetical protein CHS0354_033653 [Potamilus streckersoni]